MIRGFHSFREWFQDYESNYIIIGGTACDLLMSSFDMEFRATKDLDLVLILEVLTVEFGRKFWDYILEAGYEHRNKSSGKSQFYRFSKPKNDSYPAMIEIFSRRTDKMVLPEDAVLTPIPLEEELSSLSAILLDEDYYQFLRNGPVILDGVSILNTPYLIPFKMKAWLDLTERRKFGEKIDSRDIRKHRNDVYRMSELLGEEIMIPTKGIIKKDISEFLLKMETEELDTKQLGLRQSKEEIIRRLKNCYLRDDRGDL